MCYPSVRNIRCLWAVWWPRLWQAVSVVSGDSKLNLISWIHFSKLNLISWIHFFITGSLFSSSCHMRIGFTADDLFMELFGTPADRFPINYWLNFFLLLIAYRINWHATNLKSRSTQEICRTHLCVSCSAIFTSPNFAVTHIFVSERIPLSLQRASFSLKKEVKPSYLLGFLSFLFPTGPST